MSEGPAKVVSQEQPAARSSFGLDVTKLASGTVLAQVLGIIFTPILTRLFPPEAYGLLAVFISLTSILGVVACFRYELAIMLPEKDEEAANLLASSLLFAGIISLASVPILLFGKSLLIRIIRVPELLPFILLVPLAALLNGVWQALNYWNTRTRHFGRLSANRVLNMLVTQLSKLGSGYTGHATGGAMIGATVGGQAVATAALGAQIWNDNKVLFLESTRWKRMWNAMLRYRKFPLIDTWGALLNVVSWQLPPLMLAAFFSQAVTGYYALSFRLIQMPMALIGASLGQVFFQRASEVRMDMERLSETTEKVFKKLVSFCLLPSLLIAIAGREFFVLVFGARWGAAGVYAQILSPWAFCWFISSPLSPIFFVRERLGVSLLVHVAIFATRLISLWVGGVLGNVYLALGLFSASGVVVYGVLVFWNLALGGVSAKTGMGHVLRGLGYALPGTALLFMFKLMKAGPLAIASIAAAIMIVHFLVLMRRDTAVFQRLFHR